MADPDDLKLTPDDLYRATDPAQLGFETTADLEVLDGVAAQPRAVEALELGLAMRHGGFNVYALGRQGTGRHHAVMHFVQRRAAAKPVPDDLCYVHNFADAHAPDLLRLAAGRGRRFSADMEGLVRELPTALTAAFESDEYQSRRGSLEEEFRERQESAFQEIREAASERNLATLRTPGGIAFAPQKDGKMMERDAFLALPEDERHVFEEAMQDMQAQVQTVLRQVPAWLREHRERVRTLNEEMTRFAVGPLFTELRERYADEADVVAYLEAAEKDVVRHARQFLHAGEDGGGGGLGTGGGDGAEAALSPDEAPSLRRYAVNLMVDHADTEAAPIVHEDHPTLANLLGRVEYVARMGNLTTDFTLIKAGALHRAHGGYLVLDAEKLLRQPFAYDGLKRALASGRLRIESPAQAMGLMSTVTLEPEPMPLEVKVVLVGSRLVYYLLSAYDPEFGELFKIAADFDDRADRSADNESLWARLVASIAKQNELAPFDAGAVARLVEECARELGDSEKLSTRTAGLDDLMREAEHYAHENGGQVVRAADVERAVAARVRRADRAEQRLREEILRGTVMIDTEGAKSGQINGLAVLSLGDHMFGRPSRITSRVRMGKGEVVDIEREVKLSGPIHSKGVLILSSFLAARYAAEKPLSLSASLVFEQSYGGIDGDSASVAELTCLLSAIADVPIRQGIAVTGSVNQHGEVQAIGGVNQKIEGFFKVCEGRGLSGYQGVVIPRTNVKHLMLRSEVVAAVAAGRFHLWAVSHVDEALELLTGVAAGERDDDGTYPEGSLNRRVEDRLAELAEKRRKLTRGSKNDDGAEPDGDDETDGGDDEPPAEIPDPEPPKPPLPREPPEPPGGDEQEEEEEEEEEGDEEEEPGEERGPETESP